MRKLILGHLVYLYTPLGVLACVVGILLGGHWAWLGVAIFGFNIVVDTLTSGLHLRGAAADKDGSPAGIPAVLNSMMYMQLISFIALQLALAWRVYQYVAGVPIETMTWNGYEFTNGIDLITLVGATLSAGMHQGLGIMFGHELAHTKGIGFLISRWMMALSGTAHFCFAHVYNHHLELGRAWLGPEGNKMDDDTDPATAPRGRSIYKHFVISHIGQSYFGVITEGKRLKRMGKSFFSLSNRWIRGYMMSLPTVALFSYAGYAGGQGASGVLIGLAVMLVVWIISNFELEALNYMEHYGLIRVKNEPIEYRHSWDNDTAFTSWAFIEIGRQADHHDRGETHFWELTGVGGPPTGAPNARIGYYTEFTLALIPPLWHYIMRRKLAIWDRDFATPEERKIAAMINKKVGYDLDPKAIEGRYLEVSYV
ncbi:fatty acid desaturase [Hyphomicrobium methylovorum]|uniref:fatty acid desaturase n=1 Tax=Hyphomicrobium methylovorum TaxID=84 RepID=UPI001AEE4DFE|nr:fatty acid desaturase [Hyphomicrobium methylovorum]